MKKVLLYTTLLSLVLTATTTLAASLTIQEQIGKHLYQDKNLSANQTQSCATCHHRSSGFADPTNRTDPETTVVSLGDDGSSLGGRNAPTSAYCGYSPILTQNDNGEWTGGMFWDGRATGDRLGDPLAEQAQGPPLNSVEMNLGSVEELVGIVENSDYAKLFFEIYEDDFFSDTDNAFDEIARCIAAYERSAELNPFSSRYDRDGLSGREKQGLAAFNEAGCASCHSDTVPTNAPGAIFTNYGYANIGIPENPLLTNAETDLGLGGYLQDATQDGKFKIPTLRNVARTAPYSHNGYFSTLEDMVRYHADRGGLVPEVEETLVTPVSGGLTEQQIADIVAFLEALTDDGPE